MGKEKKRKHKHKKSEEGPKNDGWNSSEEDVGKEVHPLSHYVNSRRKMLCVALAVLGRRKLKSMLPAELQDMPPAIIKTKCLQHLEAMSKKDLKAVLNGTYRKKVEENPSSQPADSTSAEPETVSKKQLQKKKVVQKSQPPATLKVDNSWDDGEAPESGQAWESDGDLDLLEIGIDQNEMGDILQDSSSSRVKQKVTQEPVESSVKDVVEEGAKKDKSPKLEKKEERTKSPGPKEKEAKNKSPDPKKKEEKKNKSPEPKKKGEKNKSPEPKEEEKREEEPQPSTSRQKEGSRKKEKAKKTPESDKKKKKPKKKKKKEEAKKEVQGKTLMELLELEMRARAIKALLQRHETSEKVEYNSCELENVSSEEGEEAAGEKEEFQPSSTEVRNKKCISEAETASQSKKGSNQIEAHISRKRPSSEAEAVRRSKWKCTEAKVSESKRRHKEKMGHRRKKSKCEADAIGQSKWKTAETHVSKSKRRPEAEVVYRSKRSSNEAEAVWRSQREKIVPESRERRKHDRKTREKEKVPRQYRKRSKNDSDEETSQVQARTEDMEEGEIDADMEEGSRSGSRSPGSPSSATAWKPLVIKPFSLRKQLLTERDTAFSDKDSPNETKRNRKPDSTEVPISAEAESGHIQVSEAADSNIQENEQRKEGEKNRCVPTEQDPQTSKQTEVSQFDKDKSEAEVQLPVSSNSPSPQLNPSSSVVQPADVHHDMPSGNSECKESEGNKIRETCETVDGSVNGDMQDKREEEAVGQTAEDSSEELEGPKEETHVIEGQDTIEESEVTEKDSEEVGGNKEEASNVIEGECAMEESEVTKKDAESDEMSAKGSTTTWYQRWYKSQKVQKVVSASKMYGKVRNKLKSLQNTSKSEDSPKEAAPEEEEQIPSMIGTIEEYERIFGKKVVPPEETVQEQPVQEVEEEPDSDDELWGKIMGN